MEGIRKEKRGGKRGAILGWLLIVGILIQLAVMVDVHAKPVSAATVSSPDSATRARIEENFGKLPLYFIENRGQMDSRVAYYVKGHDKSLFFTSQGVTFLLRGKGELSSTPGAVIRRASYPPDTSKLDRSMRWALRLEFLGANMDVNPAGIDGTKAVVSYFKGKRDEWKAGLKTYSGVMYRDLWPGIDLIYTGTVNRLKYRFVVRPGADPERIQLAYRGASSIAINDAGQLEVKTPAGGFRDERPYTYQDVNGRRVEVATGYRVDSEDEKGRYVYGFKVGAYDKSKPLVVDPAVLVYCGYIGGNDSDIGYGIAVDGDGNAYVTGQTLSDEATFPVTVGPDLTYNGNSDVFVAKVNATGTALVYCGYIGGSWYDYGRGIVVDSDGNAYITGHAYSDEATFPVTVGPDLTHNGLYDVFVAKVNATGTALEYCGYIGGSGYDWGSGIAVDGNGNAYVTGYTDSTEATFPVTMGPDLAYNGSEDVFVAKVNATGTALDYCGYIGGSESDTGRGIAVDGDGNAYVTGDTYSDEATFPVTVGPDLTHNGGTDAFVARVNAGGTALDYCGYIGGSAYDSGQDIAVDSDGNAYVTGPTLSGEATFPVTVGPDLTFNGNTDVFVAKVNATGTALDCCGYIGGSEYDYGYGIAVDGDGNAYVTGEIESDEATFPVTVGPDLTHNGSEDVFVAKISNGGLGNELAVDFGSYGLWHYGGSTWSNLAGWDPDGNMVDWDNGLAADFGSYGLWNYDGSTWTSLAGWDPDNMKEYSTGLAVDFDTYGLWYYNGSSWTSLAGWNPGDMEEWSGGLAVDFDTYGLWNYDGSSWTSLAGWDPSNIKAYGTGMAIDFDTYGLWYYNRSSWTSLAGWNPEGMETWGSGLAVDFGTYGLWNYDGSSWTSLAGWDPADMEVYGTGLTADFNTYGLWYYDGSTWTNMASWNPEDMEAWASGLAADFGTAYGLWHYDGSSWSSLAGWNPEDMIDVDLY